MPVPATHRDRAASPRNPSEGYDRYGNRWTQTLSGSGLGPQPSFSFNAANNQIANSGYTYDAAGNMTNDGSHTYTYDADGNLLAVDGGQTASYVYDALNRRVRAQTASATYEFMYDYAGRRTSSWYNPSSGNPGAGNEGRIYWDGTQIAYRAYNGQTYFDHRDWLGTERMRTGYTGAVAATFTSLPFGDGAASTLPGGDPAIQDNASFATLDQDPESNTHHAQFRNYSPTQGRWLAPDPYDGSYDITNPQSFNRYAYVLNNPLTFTDPLGLECAIDGSGCSLGCNGDPLCGQPGIGGGGGGGGAGGSIGNDPFFGGSCCGALGGNDWNLQYGGNSWYVALLNGSSGLPSDGYNIYVGCVGPSIFDFTCMPDDVSMGYFAAGTGAYTNGSSVFASSNLLFNSTDSPHSAFAGSVALPIAPGIIFPIPFAFLGNGDICLGAGFGVWITRSKRWVGNKFGGKYRRCTWRSQRGCELSANRIRRGTVVS